MFSVSLDEDALEHLKSLKYAKRNLGRALAYFHRAVASAVTEEVQRLGRIPGVDYDELEVVYFGKVGKDSISALVLPDSFRPMEESDRAASVVTVNPSEDSPFLRMLERQSPWPPSMLPPGFERTDKATLVLRRVSVEEVEAQIARLLSDREVYENLVRWRYISGANPRRKNIEDLMARAIPRGVRVQEDIAWKVLRHEFGLGGNPSVPHWRKSLKKHAIDLDEELLYGFWGVILGTKKEGIPRKNVSLMTSMKDAEPFQEYVMSKSAASSGDPQR